MTIARAILFALAAIFAAIIAWAIMTGDFASEGNWLVTNPWGIVSLVDLYLGFLLSAIVIAGFEQKRSVALFWLIPLPFLGNVWTLVWFALRLPTLWSRLKSA